MEEKEEEEEEEEKEEEKGKSGQDLRQEPRSKNWCRGHGGVLLFGSLMLFQPAFFYRTQNHLPRIAMSAHTGLSPPTLS